MGQAAKTRNTKARGSAALAFDRFNEICTIRIERDRPEPGGGLPDHSDKPGRQDQGNHG